MAFPSTGLPLPALPRLLIADEHRLVVEALGSMMRIEYHIKAVDSYPAFAESLTTFKPDIVMVSVGFRDGDGFGAAAKAIEVNSKTPVVLLSANADQNEAGRAAQLGAKAVLNKRLSSREVLHALRAVLSGESLLDSKAPIAEPQVTSKPVQSGLTGRQIEVLRLIAQGCSAKEIAETLKISVRTAEFHRAAIMDRLGLRSTAQLTRYAVANGLG